MAAFASIKAYLQSATYLTVVHAAVEKAFATNTPMQLHRLQSLKEEIILRGLRRQISPQPIETAIMDDIKPLATLLRLNVPESNPDVPSVKWRLMCMERAVHTAIMQDVFNPLRCGGFVSCVPDDFPLAETAAVQQERSKLERRLRDLTHAHAVIQHRATS